MFLIQRNNITVIVHYEWDFYSIPSISNPIIGKADFSVNENLVIMVNICGTLWALAGSLVKFDIIWAFETSKNIRVLPCIGQKG